MPSTYTVNLGIEKPATGEQSGTWGDTTNVNFDIIDQAINGVLSLTLASAGTSGSPNTLSIDNGATSDGRNKWIEFVDGGDLGANAYVQLDPNDAEKIVFFRNSLSGSRSVFVFQGTYNTSNDFEIPAGYDVVLKFDGGGASATVTDVFQKLRVTALVTPDLTASTADINAGTIDGTTIGSSSASTGAFTTLSASSTVSGTGFSTYLASPPAIGGTAAAGGSFTTLSASGAVTLSGGTANGVAYLNGSKVLTSGSALTFDGTSLQAAAARGTYALKIYNSSDGSVAGNFGALTGNVFAIDATGPANTMTFLTGGSEAMRLNSTGLGIGTSSPNKTGYDVNAKVLTVYGPQRGAVEIGSDTPLSSNTLGALNFLSSTTVKAQVVCTLDGSSNGQLLFATNGSTRATLDSSGNLGLGVTPSAWGGAAGVGFDVGSGGAGLYSGGLTRNAFFNGTNWIYKGSDSASFLNNQGGGFSFNTAPSGTAGNAISFTQAMTLDASGRLLLGTTSADSIFTVGELADVNPVVASFRGNGYTLRIKQLGSGGDRRTEFNSASSSAALSFATNNTERARITSDGYLRMASGTGGIQFNGDTAAANALDDYETGTFTPNIVGLTTAGTGTYTTQIGRYTKIGNRVYFSIRVDWSAHTGTGSMVIDGLPFATGVSANLQSHSVGWVNGLTLPVLSVLCAYNTSASVDYISLGTYASGGGSLTALAMDTAAGIAVSGQYETDA